MLLPFNVFTSYLPADDRRHLSLLFPSSRNSVLPLRWTNVTLDNSPWTICNRTKFSSLVELLINTIDCSVQAFSQWAIHRRITESWEPKNIFWPNGPLVKWKDTVSHDWPPCSDRKLQTATMRNSRLSSLPETASSIPVVSMSAHTTHTHTHLSTCPSSVPPLFVFPLAHPLTVRLFACPQYNQWSLQLPLGCHLSPWTVIVVCPLNLLPVIWSAIRLNISALFHFVYSVLLLPQQPLCEKSCKIWLEIFGIARSFHLYFVLLVHIFFTRFCIAWRRDQAV